MAAKTISLYSADGEVIAKMGKTICAALSAKFDLPVKSNAVFGNLLHTALIAKLTELGIDADGNELPKAKK